MAYSNSDYLRRLLLTAVLFSKAWAEWRETKQGVQQPQISNSMAVTMPRPKGDRWWGGAAMGPQKEGGHMGRGQCDLQPSQDC